MTSTYIALATITLSSASSTVTFSSIPATYRDLIIVFQGRSGANVDANFKFNNDGTNTNYSFVLMTGNGSSATSGVANSWNWSFVGTAQGNIITQIMDYAATDKHKSSLTRMSVAGHSVRAYAARWHNTAAINRIELTAGGTSFNAGSTFSLYGVN